MKTKASNENEDFEDAVIKSARKTPGGWEINREDGWSFFTAEPVPFELRPGMKLRIYGNIRGLFIEGVKIFYRTAEEDEKYREELQYGRTAEELLERWDAGKSVWSIEMGGIGPHYEQAIQAAGFEFLRVIIAGKVDATLWDDEHKGEASWDKIKAAANPLIKPLGLSGAQYGAAMNIAAMFYRLGPVAAIKKAPDDRRILVSKYFADLELDPLIDDLMSVFFLCDGEYNRDLMPGLFKAIDAIKAEMKKRGA